MRYIIWPLLTVRPAAPSVLKIHFLKRKSYIAWCDMSQQITINTNNME